MANDFRKFELDLDNFCKKVELSAATVKKRVGFDLLGRLVRKTPVDTGRARGSWTIAVNEADRTVLPPAPPGQIYPPPAIGALDVRLNESLVISNNLPYIVKLNEGHSQQAPKAFVELAIEEVNVQMERICREGLKDAGL